MSINLDNILFYSAPTQQLAARITEKSRTSASYPATQRNATPSTSHAMLISNDEIKNDDDDKLVLSRLRPEAKISDVRDSKDMTHDVGTECHPVVAGMNHNHIKEAVAVETTLYENPLQTVALSSEILPTSPPSIPSGVSFAMPTLPSTFPDSDNTTDPAFHRRLTNAASDVGFKSPDGEKDSFRTGQQQLSQTTTAVNDGFLGWMQRHQTMPVKNASTNQVSEPLSQTADNTCSISVEPGLPPPTSTTLPGQDTPCHPQSSTRQPTAKQTVYDSMPNLSAGSTEQPPVGAPEPRSRATPRPSRLGLPSAGQTHTAPETTARSASPVPLPLIGRRTRKRQLPTGAYAEVDSDPEPDNEDASEQEDEEYAEAQVNTVGYQPASQNDDNTPRHKRRKTKSSQKAAATRALRAQHTSSPSSLSSPRIARQSNRIAKQPGDDGIISPPASCVVSDSEPCPEHHPAQYDEWSLPNAVLKRMTDGGVTIFQLQWELPSTEQQPQCYSSGSQQLRSPPKKPTSAKESSKRRGPFSKDEDKLLTQLKGQCSSWKEIYKVFSASFPGRSLGTLQVRFSTKLKSKRNSRAGNV